MKLRAPTYHQPIANAVGLAVVNSQATFDAIAKRRAELSFIAFVELFWPVIEPKQRFVRGWVQEQIARYLTLVHEGAIDKVLINVPPGFSKSTLCNVFFAAWEWGPKRRPDLRYISWSYSGKLTERDNVLCRKIIESPLYQRLWGQCEPCKTRKEGAPRCKRCQQECRFRLDGDQNAKTRYRNDWGGFRFASSVGGAGTGERADRLIFDDPHSVQGAESDVDRQATIDWFAGTLPSRVRNSDTADPNAIKLPEWVRRAHNLEEDTDEAGSIKSATIGIMQRVHLRDVSGVILETPELGYVHVLIEMEFLGKTHPARVANENGRIASPDTNPWGIVDPRAARLASIPPDTLPTDPTDSGAFLWAQLCNVWLRIAADRITLADPIRYPRHEVEKLKRSLLLKSGSNAVEAQFQQWPQEVGGDYFPKAMAKRIARCDLLAPRAGYKSRGWDLASTDSDVAAATVGVLMWIDIEDRVIIEDIAKVRGGPDAVDALIKTTADDDGPEVRQDLPRDPGQAGKYQINAFTKLLMGHEIDSSPETQGKATRAYPLSSQWKIGNVYIVEGCRNADEYIRIMSEFPVGRFKDEVDASSRAFDSQVRAETVRAPMPPMTIKLAR
jgi:predicted phage terminase large subunit-like protein